MKEIKFFFFTFLYLSYSDTWNCSHINYILNFIYSIWLSCIRCCCKYYIIFRTSYATHIIYNTPIDTKLTNLVFCFTICHSYKTFTIKSCSSSGVMFFNIVYGYCNHFSEFHNYFNMCKFKRSIYIHMQSRSFMSRI